MDPKGNLLPLDEYVKLAYGSEKPALTQTSSGVKRLRM